LGKTGAFQPKIFRLNRKKPAGLFDSRVSIRDNYLTEYNIWYLFLYCDCSYCVFQLISIFHFVWKHKFNMKIWNSQSQGATLLQLISTFRVKTPFFRRSQTSVQNLTSKWFFWNDNFHIILSLGISKSTSIRFLFNYWTKICLMVENWVFINISWRCLKTLIAVVRYLIVTFTYFQISELQFWFNRHFVNI